MMKMSVVGTVNKKSRVSRRIQKITKGKASHVLVRFKDSVNDVYFESHWGSDGKTKKTGVRGPIPVKKLDEWAAKDPENRRIFYTGWINIPEESVQLSYNMASWAVKNVKYSRVQIFQNWIAHRLGFYFAKRKGGAERMTCSEFASTLIPTALLATQIRIGYITYDMIVPSSDKYQTGLLEAVARMNECEVQDVCCISSLNS